MADAWSVVQIGSRSLNAGDIAVDRMRAALGCGIRRHHLPMPSPPGKTSAFAIVIPSFRLASLFSSSAAACVLEPVTRAAQFEPECERFWTLPWADVRTGSYRSRPRTADGVTVGKRVRDAAAFRLG